MSTSFSQAVEALTAQAQDLIAATSAEVAALREELEQERRFRRHLEANAAARAHEVAAQQQQTRLERERLEAALNEALVGRRQAEAELERFHAALRQQLALAEQEQAVLEQAEAEREHRRQEALQQRLREAAAAAEQQRQALLEQLAQEQRAHRRLAGRLAGVQQAVLDLLASDEAAEPEQDGARPVLRKVLMPRGAGQAVTPSLP